METLYIAEHGLQLRKKSDRILVRRKTVVVQEIPLRGLKRIVVLGNSHVTTELMRHLALKGVDLAFLSSHGRYRFRIVAHTSKNIFLRIAQHDRHRDKDFRLALGQTIVSAKCANQRSLLLRSRRNQPDAGIDRQIATIKKCRTRIQETDNLSSLMGVEGTASRAFFSAFGRLLLGGFEMKSRQYHPPPDPVNAMLSFGYMLLFNEIEGLLEGYGFDVFLGYLHGVQYGRASLVCDMVEEFRSPVVDRLVLYLVNRRMIKPEDFTVTKKKGARLHDEARNSYISNYEKFMTAAFQYGNEGKLTTFRQILQCQVHGLSQALLKGEQYAPFRFSS